MTRQLWTLKEAAIIVTQLAAKGDASKQPKPPFSSTMETSVRTAQYSPHDHVAIRPFEENTSPSSPLEVQEQEVVAVVEMEGEMQ